MKKTLILCIMLAFGYAKAQQLYIQDKGGISLTQQGASHLASLPLKCLDKTFPFKSWITMSDSSFITNPKNLHPAFCGCFDWHSCVHAHWLLVSLLKQFPGMPEADSILRKLQRHLSAENIKTELALFKGDNKTFERPYGWGWLLQLQNELLTWNSPEGKELSNHLQPLAQHISGQWKLYLDNLQYPVREPEHFNTAMGMCLTWDYTITTNDTSLQKSIKTAAMRFYAKDVNCPTSYEPGGYDFLSPCLVEADLMQRIMPKNEFNVWLKDFMPLLYSKPSELFSVGVVSDPTDGKMVHLYGLNFNRAWCLYHIAAKMPEANAPPVRELALQHFMYSLPHVVSGAYEGDHWLATFVVYALKSLK